jgi:ornithine carbamoyltransferase
MTSARHAGSLVADTEMTKNRFMELVSLAAELKRDKHNGAEHALLAGAAIVLVFEKNSTRTRAAFEVAAHDQGAHVTYLGPEGSHVGKEESIPDTARVLGRMYDGIAFRGFAQETVVQLADNAGVPVWNALSDQWHPTQMLADILTMTEHQAGPLEDITFCFAGDGRNNVARSLLMTGALLGLDVRIAAPAGLQPPADVVAAAQAAAATSGASILVTPDVAAGVSGADFVYTDLWLSMGEDDDEWAARVRELLPYRVTEQLMRSTGKPGTKFMHCLPAIHNSETTIGARLHEQFGLDGAEVTEQVFESPDSIVFDQAENRLHTIKALMIASLAH